ncbi:hypothetical protein ABT369_38615 [Dactylosporangium sp. NPDC000244]|uniref:hypothetical protein n=1 Tax=Dactylosporangium sp. NPDC000244 TaxID=3154365 RepID=UPI00331AF2FF
MSYQRVENVLYHAPAWIDPAAKLVLIAVAAKLAGTDPERTVSMGQDDLVAAANVDHRNVRRALARLADGGIEIRVALSKDKNGDPVYAHRGSVGQFRVPWFPKPDECGCPTCHKGGRQRPPSSARKADAKAGTSAPLSEGKADSSAPLNPRKADAGGQKGGRQRPPLPTNQASKPSIGRPENAAHATSHTQNRADGSSIRTPLPESLQLIVDTLADADITEVEARAVHSRFITERKPQGTRLFHLVAGEGGIPWRTALAGIRADAKAANIAKIAELGRSAPCPHGQPGGDQPHPRTGEPLCPLCRTGTPAPDPDQPKPVETYRRLYTTTHERKPGLDLMAAVGQQHHELAKRGATPRQLDAVAASAAINGHDLITELRQQKERASA